MWLLEELNLDYDIKVYFRQKDKHSPPELKQVHPLGKSPLISIEAPSLEEPLVLAESAAIVEYVSDHFGQQLIPKRYPDGKDGLIGAETKEWLRFRVSTVPYTVVRHDMSIPSATWADYLASKRRKRLAKPCSSSFLEL